MGDDVAEERHAVAVDLGLPEGQGPEDGEHDRGKARRGHARPRRQAPRAKRRRARQHRNRSDPGQILVAVGDEGELHVAVIHETEHRRQRDREERRAGEGSAADPAAQDPERRAQGDNGRQTAPGQRVGGVDRPMRVDDGEAGGPEQLFDVEPQRMRGDQRPLDHRVAEIQRLPGRGVCRVGGGDGDAHGEERGQPQQVGAVHPAALPPMADQERRRQSDDDGLAEQTEDEQDEGEEVVFPPAPF